MPDLRAELENALRPRFEIRRELGGGGMSRVFLAREVELDRDIVIKVLPPETAGLNLARFRRETQTAAKLHHPHIVPLHASGDAAGVLYYTMPFVDGETLRSRMASAKQLPTDEVIRVLRDVADALAYAHQHQVVHRDIKPENVLLSSGHALVTDFGVAKALSALGARPSTGTDDEPRADSTVSGLAIGTPAYMAPEQAAGDPLTDHRADIYALGLLGYEMLAGRSPFASSASPHEMIAAQIAEKPRPIGDVRPDTPLLLASLLMRCLEKRPDDRPPSAAVVREQLDAMRTPSGGGIRAGSWPRGRMPRAILAGAVLVPLIALAIVFKRADGRPTLDRNVVAVAPFRVSGEASMTYLREGMLDLFAAKLTGEGGPRAADPRSVLSAWRRAAGSDTAELTRESALRVAEDLGVGQLLLGDVSGTPARLTISATLLDVHDGRLRGNATATGPVDSLPQMIDGVTAQLLTLRAGEGARMATLTSTSLPALRAYLSGQWLFRKGRYKAAGDEHKKALTLDSTFALAAIASMEAAVWYGDHQEFSRAGSIAWKNREKLSARDRALLVAQLGPKYPQQSSLAETVGATAKYRDIAPDRADAWFHYGDALVHHGPVIGNTTAHAQAETALNQAVAIDSSYAPALEHLVLLAASRGDTAATRRYARLFLAADSVGESAAGIRWRLAVATGDTSTADSISSVRTPLPPTSNSIVTWMALEDGIRVPQSYALLKSVGEREVREGQFGSYLMMHDVAQVLGRPVEARAMLAAFERNVGPAPKEKLKDALIAEGDIVVADSAAGGLQREWLAPRPTVVKATPGWAGTQCLVPLYRMMARADTTFARESLARLRALASDSIPVAGYAGTCAILVDATLAVRSGAPDARVRVARADSVMRTGPANPTAEFGNSVVARLWEAVGDRDSALSALRRRGWFYGRKQGYAVAIREEGRLAAETGDIQGAISAYRHFLALREPAEPSVQREVEGIRAEIKRLERASAGR